MAKIVVGVDASPGALLALTWAADEARLRTATLEVVHAYHGQELAAPLFFPSTEALPAQATAGQRPPKEQPAQTAAERAQFQAAVRRQAEDLLDSLLGELRDTLKGINVRRAVLGRVPARPERVRAGLLAVRRRRRDGRLGLAAPARRPVGGLGRLETRL